MSKRSNAEVSIVSQGSGNDPSVGKGVSKSKSAPRPSSKVRNSAENQSATNMVGQNVVQTGIAPSSQSDGDGNARPPHKLEGMMVKEVGKLDDEVFKPFGPPSRSSSVADNVEDFQCPGGPSKTCGKPVTDEDEGVLCDACGCWFHSGCQGVSEPEMRALICHKALAWLCSRCKYNLKGSSRNGSCCTRLETRIRVLEEGLSVQTNLLRRVNECQELLVNSMKENHDELKTIILEHSMQVELNKTKEEEKRCASYASIVKGSCVDVINSLSAKIETMPQKEVKGEPERNGHAHQIAGIVDSVLDKEKRRRNIVVHNLPESDAQSTSDRAADDMSLFTQLVKEEFHVVTRVTKSFRAGKVIPGKQRLLIVTLESEDSKWEIIRLAPQLRHSEAWGKVYLSPDLTRSEREESRRLREELKKRKENGETNLMIRNKRIIQSEKEGSSSFRAANQMKPNQATTSRPLISSVSRGPKHADSALPSTGAIPKTQQGLKVGQHVTGVQTGYKAPAQVAPGGDDAGSYLPTARVERSETA